MPAAFVVMPFDVEFEAIYTDFIRPELERAGYSVERADDIASQRNILRDVLEKIDQSDLIVADLTSANPNVFYELGLAHALRKPTILITQSIDDVPFDLKSYRLLQYSTHFSLIGKARDQLAKYATGFAQGTIQFGSPVTDFYQDGAPERRGHDPAGPETPVDGGRGLIDHLEAFNNGYDRIANLIGGATQELEDLTKSLNATSGEFERISANPNASSVKAARAVSRRLATRMGHFSSQMKKANDEYATIAQDTEDSLEFVVSFQQEQSTLTASAIEQRNTMLAELGNLESIVILARDSQLELATQMDRISPIERWLNREAIRAREEVLVMASNLDRTIASISRVLKKYA